MPNSSTHSTTDDQQAITYIDAQRLHRALRAGIHHVLERREYINKINVFPVADSDTGTNLAFTLRSVQEALGPQAQGSVSRLLRTAADAAVDGARGNSGAIMAQFFQGLREGARRSRRLNAKRLAAIVRRGSQSARSAMAQPVEGTLPTVLHDFSDELADQVKRGIDDIRLLLERGLERAHRSLANTPNLLPALKEAGVVDAGAQGFVDFLEGIVAYIRDGHLPEYENSDVEISSGNIEHQLQHGQELTYRYCTECLISADHIERKALQQRLMKLDADSLVVAGSQQRIRIHIHTNQPAQVFLACEEFGQLSQQKADDMQRQHGLLNQHGTVAIVSDSGADLPADEIERLSIHRVPLRLNIGDQEYLDGISLSPDELYERVGSGTEHPQTSQPPPGDFRRQYELLTSHGYEVISLHLSGRLSGTMQAAQSAASRHDADRVHIYDTHNASSGHGLMAMLAAEAASAGMDTAAILNLLDQRRDLTQTFAVLKDMTWGVRGGRIPAWAQRIAQWLRLQVILANTPDGLLKAKGAIITKPDLVPGFARWLLKRMDKDTMYRLMISHCACLDDAKRLRDTILSQHDLINGCWITSTGPAVGVHAGPGSLVVGIQKHIPWNNAQG